MQMKKEEPRGHQTARKGADCTSTAVDCKAGSGPEHASLVALRTQVASPAGSAHDFLATPELAEELLHRGREGVVVQPVDHVLALTLVDDQVGLFQDG